MILKQKSRSVKEVSRKFSLCSQNHKGLRKDGSLGVPLVMMGCPTQMLRGRALCRDMEGLVPIRFFL